MKAEIYKTSTWYIDWKTIIKDFNTLEEFINFCKETGDSIIISIPKKTDCNSDWCDMTLEIYDDWRE